MSEIEVAKTARADTKISSIATGKLRSLGGNAGLFAESEGLVDAFAEVFASIAAATTQPLDPAPSSGDPGLSPNSSQDWDDEHSGGLESQEARASDESREPVDFQVQLDAPSRETPVVAGPDLIDDASVHQPLDLAGEESGKGEAGEEVLLAAAEVVQTEATVEAVANTEQQVAAESTRRQRRDRPDSVVTEPADTPVQSSQFGDKATRQDHVHTDDAIQSPGDGEIDSVPESQGAGDPTGEEGGRRRSRHDHRNSVEPSPNRDAQAVSQNASGSARSSLGLSEVTATAPASSAPELAKTAAPPVPPPVVAAVANARSASPQADSAGNAAQARASVRGIASSTGLEEPAGSNLKPPVANVKGKQSKAGVDTSETVSRVKLVQRVSRAFQHLGPEGGVIRLRLAPAEMGSVRVEMRIQQRNVNARVVAETEAASSALREHLPDLRARLESYGMNVESIEIETESSDLQHQQNSFSDHDFQQRSGDRQNGNSRGGKAERLAKEVSPQVSPVLTHYHANPSNGGVDIRL